MPDFDTVKFGFRHRNWNESEMQKVNFIHNGLIHSIDGDDCLLCRDEIKFIQFIRTISLEIAIKLAFLISFCMRMRWKDEIKIKKIYWRVERE